ncbi:MAG: hypothetical protein WAU89_21865 [Candidatus Acidiferrales bacterium]
MSDQETEHREWQMVLRDLKQERDPEKLSDKLQQVEALILERLRDLHRKDDGSKEHDALKEALFTLRMIKHDRLGFPDWQ